MNPSDHNDRVQRREFLSQLGVIAAVSGLAATASAGGERTPDVAASLPSIQLGQHQLSRLVAGWNPIGGHSYLGPHMDRHMKEYFTVERTVQFLLDCEKAVCMDHAHIMESRISSCWFCSKEHYNYANHHPEVFM